jgi:hypothetical protein
MTEYEYADLFNEYMNLIFTVFMGHASLVFAFLIAGYLVAHKLRPLLAYIAIMLFTIAIGLPTFVQNRFGGAMMGLAAEIRQASESSASLLAWHSITYEPEQYIVWAMYSITFVMVMSYVAALVFFFYQRKHGGSVG